MVSHDIFLRLQQGEWEYVIDNLAPSHSSIVVQVMSSPSSSEDTARTEVWTSAGTGALNATAAPLIIYASVSDLQDSASHIRPCPFHQTRERRPLVSINQLAADVRP